MERATGVSDRDAGWRTRFLFWLVKRRLRRVPLGTRLRAHDPKLLANSLRMDAHTASPGAVSLMLKELAQLKVAVTVGCPF